MKQLRKKYQSIIYLTILYTFHFNYLIVKKKLSIQCFFLRIKCVINKITFNFPVRPHMAETTSLGAAIAAGLAEGVNALDIEHLEPGPNDVFNPRITEQGN